MTKQLEAFTARLRAMHAQVESPELRYRLLEMDRRLARQCAGRPIETRRRWRADRLLVASRKG
jgi:hypothetical protein